MQEILDWRGLFQPHTEQGRKGLRNVEASVQR